MAEDTEKMSEDILQAFDFVRFIVKHPNALRKIKNGVDVKIVSALAASHRSNRSGKVQSFVCERVFHSI